MEEAKLSLFGDDIIFSIREPEDSNIKLLEFIGKFGKVAGHTLNTQNSTAFVCTSYFMSEKELL